MVAAFAAATISACEKNPAGEAENYDSEIRLTGANFVKVDAAESEFTVTFEVSGEHRDGTVTAEPGNDWLSIVPVKSGDSPVDVLKSAAEDSGEGNGSENGSGNGSDAGSEDADPVVRTLKFKAAENCSAGSRSGFVTFRLKGAKPVKCTVIQAANPDYVVNSQMTFSLDVTDIAESSVKFTVAPSIPDSYYFYAFVKKESYDSYGGNYVSITVREMQDYAESYAEKNEKTFDLKSHLYKDYISATATGFDPDTDYCLVAFDLTLGYGYSGNIAVYNFRTKAMQASSAAFTLTYDRTTGILMYTPAATTTGIFCIDVCPLSTWEAAKSPSALVSQYLENNKNSLATYDASEGARGIPVAKYADVESGEEYVGFAFSYNRTANKASNIAWLQFTL